MLATPSCNVLSFNTFPVVSFTVIVPLFTNVFVRLVTFTLNVTLFNVVLSISTFVIVGILFTVKVNSSLIAGVILALPRYLALTM